MKPEERLTRARIQIQRKNSFFAYLSLFLKFQENNDLPEWAGVGVDEQGNFYYKKEFIEKLSDEELKGTIIHEILHLSLLHLLRRKERNNELWNIACDIVVNELIKKNSFVLPKGCLISDENNNIKIFGFEIKDCDKKIAEEIYEELEKVLENNKNFEKNKNKDRFDEHYQGKEFSEKEKRELEKKWIERANEALTIAKMKGDIPLGIERMIGALHKEQINWKALLYRCIVNQIPYDYTWQKCGKKSIACGEYLPDIIKEKVEVCVVVDLSGSIGQEELDDFLSEIIGMAKAFQERLDIHLLTHEISVNDYYQVKNGSIEKIKKLKMRGGGGTSHIGVFNYIKERINAKCVVFLTDGYSDLDNIDFSKYSFEKIFVLSKNGTDAQLKNKKCIIINLRR